MLMSDRLTSCLDPIYDTVYDKNDPFFDRWARATPLDTLFGLRNKEYIFGTITLSPALLKHPIKTQLNMTYNIVAEAIGVGGLAVVELTKVGNVHYHFIYETTFEWIDDDKLMLIDGFKHHRSKRLDNFIFGYSKIELSHHPKESFKYLLKDIEKTEAIFKKLKISRGAILQSHRHSLECKKLRNIISKISVEQSDNVEIQQDNYP